LHNIRNGFFSGRLVQGIAKPRDSNSSSTFLDFSNGIDRRSAFYQNDIEPFVFTDKLLFSKAFFTALASITPTAAGVALTPTDFISGTTITDASSAGQHLLYNSSTGFLYYDADGAGGVAGVQVALIGSTTHAALVSTDILVTL
jgi:Ca2+-binding RTX toxin-like protein